MMSANIGDLRVWHIWTNTSGCSYEARFPVKSVTEAQAVINTRANEQVNDDSVEWNTFGLEIYEYNGDDAIPEWCEWYNEDCDTIEDIEQEEE